VLSHPWRKKQERAKDGEPGKKRGEGGAHFRADRQKLKAD
jgi:hypothetical protein